MTPYETGEGHLQSNLVHDNVVPVLTVRHEDSTGLTAIVMPYWGRATLQDVREALVDHGDAHRGHSPQLVRQVARDRCGPYRPVVPQDRNAAPPSLTYHESIARLALELAEALAYMHDQGVLHRDLKPTNILLTPAGRPLLMDFNLSATVERGDVLLGGTVPYMPPELLRSIIAEWADVSEGEWSKQVFGRAIPRDELPTVRGFRLEPRASSRPLARPAPTPLMIG